MVRAEPGLTYIVPHGIPRIARHTGVFATTAK